MLNFKSILFIIVLVECFFLWNTTEWERSLWASRARTHFISFNDRVNEEELPIEYVREISSSFSNIHHIPNEIDKYNRLTTFIYTDNQVTAVPSAIGNLQYLKTLDLNHNRIEQLPKTIGNLKSLEVLDLSNNQLEELPYAINDLRNLKKLNVSWNPLRTLNLDKNALPHLRKINIEKTDLSKEDIDFLKLQFPDAWIVYMENEMYYKLE